MCYDRTNRGSFKRLLSLWVPEIRHHAPSVPFLIVSTKRDLADDAQIAREVKGGERGKCVEDWEGENLAELVGARGFVSVSAKTQKNLKDVFEGAMRAVLLGDEKKPNSKGGVVKSILKSIFGGPVGMKKKKEKEKGGGVKKKLGEPMTDRYIPFDIMGLFLEYFDSPRFFFTFVSMSKGFHHYVCHTNPSCCRTILFKVQGKPKSKKEFVIRAQFDEKFHGKNKSFMETVNNDPSSSFDFAVFPNLEELHLQKILLKCPDFSSFSNLKRINFKGCSSIGRYNPMTGLIPKSFKLSMIKNALGSDYRALKQKMNEALAKTDFDYLRALDSLEEVHIEGEMVLYPNKATRPLLSGGKLQILSLSVCSNIIDLEKLSTGGGEESDSDYFQPLKELHLVNYPAYHQYGYSQNDQTTSQFPRNLLLQEKLINLTKLEVHNFVFYNDFEFEQLQSLRMMDCMIKKVVKFNLPTLIEFVFISRYAMYAHRSDPNECLHEKQIFKFPLVERFALSLAGVRDDNIDIPNVRVLEVRSFKNLTGSMLARTPAVRTLILRDLSMYQNVHCCFDMRNLVYLKKLEKLEIRNCGSLAIKPFEGMETIRRISVRFTGYQYNRPNTRLTTKFLKGLKEVSSLVLEKLKVPDSIDLKTFPVVQEVELYELNDLEEISFADNVHLETVVIKKCSAVESVSFVNVPALNKIDFIELNKLEHVKFEGKNSVTEFSVREGHLFGGFYLFPNLISLRVVDNQLLQDSHIKKLTRLEKLVMKRCSLIRGVFIKSVPNLVELKLEGGRNIDDGIVGQLPNSLKVLGLTWFTTIGSQPELFCHLPNLEEVHFKMCRSIDDRAFSRMPNLKRIYLKYCPLVKGSKISKMKSLLKLSVTNCDSFEKKADLSGVTVDFKKNHFHYKWY